MVNNITVNFQFATVLDITLISRSTWSLIGKPNQAILSASGDVIQLIGELRCNVSFKNKHFVGVCYHIDCLVLIYLELIGLNNLNFNVPLILMFNTLQVTSSSEIKKRKSQTHSKPSSAVFKLLLNLVLSVFGIFLRKIWNQFSDPNVQVPYATKDNKLDPLQQAWVIHTENYSLWMAPIIIIKKANGKMCQCSDYSTGLNEALDSHKYPLVKLEHLFTKLKALQSWATILLDDDTIKYQLTNKIGQAEALLGFMDSYCTQMEGTIVTIVAVELEVSTVLASKVRSLPVTPPMFCEATACDPLL